MRQSARVSDQPDVQECAGEIGESRSNEETRRILIADDDPSIVKLLADHCAHMGFDVDTAFNGMQAVLRARQRKPDTLVIDVNMPEVDGLSVCAHLLDPEKRPLNVIVITGSKDLDTVERCEGFGAYYARKGPNFWSDLDVALAEIHPRMIARIRQFSADRPAVRMRPRVLLIDDDNDINEFLTSRLGKCGLDVKYACDARQGLRMACSDEPAVIITDYFMPNGNAQYLLTRQRPRPRTSQLSFFPASSSAK